MFIIMRSKSSKNKNYWRGVLAEYWVAFLLWCQFYHVEKIRYKTKVGEIDIVARRGDTRHFIEVKYRNNFTDGLMAVSPKSQLRIKRAGEHYCVVEKKESSKLDFNMQCDVVAVNKYFWVKHIKNAF